MMQKGPPEVFLPAPIEKDLSEALEAMSRLQRYPLSILPRPMQPGQSLSLKADLWVKAFQTHHPVPSLGYELVRRVKKLKPEFQSLPGAEIGQRRRAGEDLFVEEERSELAYATDTLVQVLDNNPQLYKTRVLVIECSFLDERKPVSTARAGCHIHLDELLERASLFENEHVVFMHLSQVYSPNEAREILERRCPTALKERLMVFAPDGPWPY
jgi:ribonuclease Z